MTRMLKKFLCALVLLSLSLTLIACGDNPENTSGDQKDLQDNGDSQHNENIDDQDVNNDDEDLNNDETNDDDNNDETAYEPVDNGFMVTIDAFESRETNSHQIIIEHAGVYDIYTASLIDTVGKLYLAGEEIERDGRIDDFLITIFLEPNTYEVEVGGFSRDDFGTYGLYLEYREDLSDVHYYVINSVSAYDTNEHAFTITVAGTYRIYGESETNIQGTLYNSSGNYLTTDFDSHDGLGFFIEYTFEVGTYEIHIRGYDWSEADYEILIYQD